MHNLFKSKTKTKRNKNFSDAEFFFCFSLFASVGWILFLVLFCRKIKLDHQYLKIARAYYQKRIQSYRFGLFLNANKTFKNDSISNRKKQTSKWIYKHFSGITKHFRLFVRSDYLFITTIDSIFDVFCVYNPHIEIETNKQTQ